MLGKMSETAVSDANKRFIALMGLNSIPEN